LEVGFNVIGQLADYRLQSNLYQFYFVIKKIIFGRSKINLGLYQNNLIDY